MTLFMTRCCTPGCTARITILKAQLQDGHCDDCEQARTIKLWEGLVDMGIEREKRKKK